MRPSPAALCAHALLASLLLAGSCSSSPGDVAADPAEPDAAGSEQAEPDPAEPDPAEPDPAEPDPAEPDPTEPDPAEPDPVEPDPAEPDPAEPDPAEPDPAEPDPAEPDPAEPDPAEPDPELAAPDCAALAAAGVEVCGQAPGACGAVFTNGQGCAAVCAAAGLVCGATWEDDGACGADLAREALSCAAPSGHTSDYCLCAVEGACAEGACEAPATEPLPQPPVDPGCGSYPFSAEALLAERAGFGRAATGGDPDQVYTVTTLSGGTSGTGNSGSLRRALQSDEAWWIVFDVEGTITFNEEVDVQSNKTVDGRGRAIHVRGGWRLEDVRNIIISDVRLSNDLEGHCTQAGDVLTLLGDGTDDPAAFSTRDIWVHHVELENGGDGLFDLRGASRVTLSWSHLHTHKKAMLMWQNQSGGATPGMHVTLHHNWFDRLSLRGPQFVYGKLHFVNNFQDRWYEYGAGSFGGAQLLSEANVFRPREVCSLADYALGNCEDPNPCGDNQPFDGRENALVNDWASNGVGYVKSVGDVVEDGASVIVHQPDQVFDAATYYGLSADPAGASLVDAITAGAGPRVGYCQ